MDLKMLKPCMDGEGYIAEARVELGVGFARLCQTLSSAEGVGSVRCSPKLEVARFSLMGVELMVYGSGMVNLRGVLDEQQAHEVLKALQRLIAEARG